MPGAPLCRCGHPIKKHNLAGDMRCQETPCDCPKYRASDGTDWKPATPRPKEDAATAPPSASMAPGWKRDLANRCFDGERPSRMNGEP